MPSPSELRQCADQLQRLASRVDALAAEHRAFAGQVTNSGWQGSAAESFLGTITATAGHLAALAGPVTDLAGATAVLAEEVARREADVTRAAQIETDAHWQAEAERAALAVAYPGEMLMVNPLMGIELARAEAAIQSRLDDQVALAERLREHANALYAEAEHTYRHVTREVASRMQAVGKVAEGVMNDLLSGAAVFSAGLALRELGRAGSLGQELEGLGGPDVGRYVGEVLDQIDAGYLEPDEFLSALTARIQSGEIATQLFEHQEATDLLSGGTEVFGSAANTVGFAFAGLGAVGDIATLINPPQHHGVWSAVDRGAAAANLAVTAGSVALPYLVSMDAVAGWVPVAGQVLLVGTGLYMLGATLYANWKPFRDVVNDAARDIAGGAEAVGHAAFDVAHAVVSVDEAEIRAAADTAYVVGDAAVNAAHAVTHAASDAAHAAERAVSGAESDVSHALSDLGSLF